MIIFVFFEKEIVDGKNAVTSDRYIGEDNIFLVSLTLLHCLMAILKFICWIMSSGRIEIMKEWRSIFETVTNKMHSMPKYKKDEASL